jgi:hypothetical protein
LDDRDVVALVFETRVESAWMYALDTKIYDELLSTFAFNFNVRRYSVADALPFAKHTHSKLVCHVTKLIMDEVGRYRLTPG